MRSPSDSESEEASAHEVMLDDDMVVACVKLLMMMYWRIGVVC